MSTTRRAVANSPAASCRVDHPIDVYSVDTDVRWSAAHVGMLPMPPRYRRRPGAPRRHWGSRHSRSSRQSQTLRRVPQQSRAAPLAVPLKRQGDRFGHQSGHLGQEIVCGLWPRSWSHVPERYRNGQFTASIEVRTRDVDAALMRLSDGRRSVALVRVLRSPTERCAESPVTNSALYDCRSSIWLSRHRSPSHARAAPPRRNMARADRAS